MTLIEFLLARIADDEEYGQRFGCNIDHAGLQLHSGCQSRVLADGEAKRRIIKLHGPEFGTYYSSCPSGEHPPEEHWICATCGGLPDTPCETLQIIALPYADHPDYQQEWRP